MSQNKRKYQYSDIVTHTSLCAPACRMVAIQAWSSDGETGYRLYPVIALESRTVDTYLRKTGGGVRWRELGSHLEYIEAGWDFSGQETGIHPVILDEELGPICSDGELFRSNNTSQKTVYADWPSEEDGARLASEIEFVIADAVRAERFHREITKKRMEAGHDKNDSN